ncbi:FAD-linked oxidoreductase [Psilocybe cubensis]|uniref:FAD-linked oxidoreductase n=2 Tax=Psilocybe cubensis TaxID=181762 RepID=A0ACB8H9I1_PSICU|nr:FAD-linked oxidoreductase [Psilocybe cubensis]KAH9484479.1 FAD-linked oxidoreductase [Psilocybe cubensis]
MASQSSFAVGASLSLTPITFGQSPLCGSLAPTATEWSALNETVEGRLYHGQPWAKSCFSTYNGNIVQRNEDECKYVQENFFNSHVNRSHAFGAYSATQYEGCMATGESCVLDWLNPSNPDSFAPPRDCSHGAVSPYYIDVRKKEDVIAAFKFSKTQKVPLAIKNTGHDFLGRSSAPYSLGLWMHNLKYISHNSEFIPEGCHISGQPALTFGAGTQFYDISEFTDKHGLQMVGGSDQSVGAAGGWAQGGGHSALTPVYGMGADRTLQYKIVTPDGVFRTVNACQDEDLFFALRGGGGGTFGVVLEATMMVSPKESFRVANINWPVSNQNLQAVLDIFLDNITIIAENGWGGYLTPSSGNLVFITPTLEIEDAKIMMEPLVKLTTELGGSSSVTEVDSYDEWFKGWVNGTMGSQDPVGLPIALASRLIPAKNHETEQSRLELRDALMNAFANSAFSQIHITTPYGFKGSQGLDTSVHPAWRTTLYQVILVNSWFWDATNADRELAYSQSTKAVNFLRDITPDGGAYHNEADIHEPNFEESFWGGHYPRLLEIKQKYDPEHLLDCWHCVGWKGSEDPQYRCYI